MWLLTYVGALFNGLTLLILGERMSELQPTWRDVIVRKGIRATRREKNITVGRFSLQFLV